MKAIITIIGLPGSGKTTLGDMINERLKGARINADVVRSSISRDLKFSDDDRAIQAWRMGRLAAIALAVPATVVCGSEAVWNLNKTVVVDFVNPTEHTRRTYEWAIQTELPFPVRKYTIWMDTITPEQSRYPDTAKLFEPPRKLDRHISGWQDPQGLNVIADAVARDVSYSL